MNGRAGRRYHDMMFAWVRKWPRAAALVAVLVLGAFALNAFAAWRVLGAEPPPAHEGWEAINALVASWQPEGEDAWPTVRAALEAEFGRTKTNVFPNKREREFFKAIADTKSIEGDLSHEAREALRRAVSPYKSLDKALEQIVSAPALSFVFNEDASLSDTHQPGPGRTGIAERFVPGDAALTLTTLSRYAIARMIIAAGEPGAAELPKMYLASQRISYPITLLDSMFGARRLHETVGVSHTVLARLIDSYNLPPEVCTDLLAYIREEETASAGFLARPIDFTALLMRDSIEARSTPSGLLRHDPSSGRPPVISDLLSAWAPRRDEALRAIDDWRGRMLSAARLQGADRAGAIDEIDAWARATPAVGQLAGWMVAPGEYFKHFDHARSRLAGVRVMLLLELHHAATGEWPATLADALAAEDRLDPVTGDEFGYARTPDDPARGPYTLEIPDKSLDAVRRAIVPRRLTAGSQR